MFPPVDPILIRIGPIAVHWYGLLIVSGVMLGAIYAANQAARQGISPDHIWNGLVLCVILGIIGARLYHVFSSPQGGGLGWAWYRDHPEDIIKNNKSLNSIYRYLSNTSHNLRKCKAGIEYL